MRRDLRSALVAAAGLAAALGAAACATPRAPDASPARDDWHSLHGRDHPWVGRIHETASGRVLEADALFDRLAAVDLVLLGERHDNPDHHRLQARVLDALVARGRRPAVAFEMLAEDQGPALAAARASGTEAIRAAVRWDESGWPPWPLYAPIFEVALRQRLPIVAANLARRDAAALRGHGLEGLEADTRSRLGLDAPASAEETRALADQIRAAHCGYAPESMLPRLVAMQRAWNAKLADSLAAASRLEGADGAVLVAGAEHVRRDRGAPAWIARRAPDASLASVALAEVDPDDPNGGGLPEADAAAFDYVWYTPRVDLDDPCDKYRDQLERMQRGGSAAPSRP